MAFQDPPPRSRLAEGAGWTGLASRLLLADAPTPRSGMAEEEGDVILPEGQPPAAAASGNAAVPGDPVTCVRVLGWPEIWAPKDAFQIQKSTCFRPPLASL